MNGAGSPSPGDSPGERLPDEDSEGKLLPRSDSPVPKRKNPVVRGLNSLLDFVNSTAVQTTMYIAFVYIFQTIAETVRQPKLEYYFNKQIADVFLENHFDGSHNAFGDIRRVADIWEWGNTVLWSGFYSNGGPCTDDIGDRFGVKGCNDDAWPDGEGSFHQEGATPYTVRARTPPPHISQVPAHPVSPDLSGARAGQVDGPERLDRRRCDQDLARAEDVSRDMHHASALGRAPPEIRHIPLHPRTSPHTPLHPLASPHTPYAPPVPYTSLAPPPGACYPELKPFGTGEEDEVAYGYNWTRPDEPPRQPWPGPWRYWSAAELGSNPEGQMSAAVPSMRMMPTSGFAAFVIPFFR